MVKAHLGGDEFAALLPAVREAELNEICSRILRSVDSAFVVDQVPIDLGHRLGMQVIAEGVETQEMWDRLASLGCDVAQGFHMARPMSATDIGGWYLHSLWGAGKTPEKQVHRRLARAFKPRAS